MSMGYEGKGSGIDQFRWSKFVFGVILVKGLASSSFRGLVKALGANESERKVIILSSSPVKLVRAGHLVLSSHWSRIGGRGTGQHRPPQDRPLSLVVNHLKCTDVQSEALNLFGGLYNI